MNEKSLDKNTQSFELDVNEPEVNSENSYFNEKDLSELIDGVEEGQSSEQDPSQELLLGKFKSVDDLAKAYEELQRRQGLCSEELGSLRKELAGCKSFRQGLEQIQALQNRMLKTVDRDREKYNSPEYFQDPTFREMYKEAYQALGENLDTDRFITLLESYVNARIFANDRKKAAADETQQVLDSMVYEKNPKASFVPPKKRVDEMSEKEIDDLLEKLI